MSKKVANTKRIIAKKINNKIDIFANNDFGLIKVLLINNELWFIGASVARTLGYVDIINDLEKYIDEEDKREVIINDFNGRMLIETIINEKGLHNLILSSKLPNIKEVKEWIMKEINEYKKKSIFKIDNEVEIFRNKDFGEIRVLTINDKPWFIEKDIIKVLRFNNSNKDINTYINKEDIIIETVSYYKCGDIVKDQIVLINENGLYDLISYSKLTKAKKWIITEVLPKVNYSSLK